MLIHFIQIFIFTLIYLILFIPVKLYLFLVEGVANMTIPIYIIAGLVAGYLMSKYLFGNKYDTKKFKTKE